MSKNSLTRNQIWVIIIQAILAIVLLPTAIKFWRSDNIFLSIICFILFLGSIAGIANIIKDAINDRKRKKRDRQNAEKSQAKQNDKKLKHRF